MAGRKTTSSCRFCPGNNFTSLVEVILVRELSSFFLVSSPDRSVTRISPHSTAGAPCFFAESVRCWTFFFSRHDGRRAFPTEGLVAVFATPVLVAAAFCGGRVCPVSVVPLVTLLLLSNFAADEGRTRERRFFEGEGFIANVPRVSTRKDTGIVSGLLKLICRG